MTKISIIVPVYNVSGYLERCLDSILNQSFDSFEVILVDDGSTDGSPEICDGYARKDSRVRCVHKSNGGVSSARNCGLSYAGGEFVMFVDSDDALAEDALAHIADLLADSPVDFVLGSYDIYTNDAFDRTCRADSSGGYDSCDMLTFLDVALGDDGALFRSPWAKVFRRAVIHEAALEFNESLCYAEDKLFVYGFLQHAVSAAVLPYPIYRYYRHSGTLSWGKTDVKRASRLLDMIPHYHVILSGLICRYPGSQGLRRVFHNDLFCGDIMRVFRVFMRYRTDLLSAENAGILYSIMDDDRDLRLFERRVPGQVIVAFFHRSGLRMLSVPFYRAMAAVFSLFRS